jgi:hypothetical protein
VNGLNADTIYYFRIYAINAAGNGTYSGVLSNKPLYLSIVVDNPGVAIGVAPGRMSSNKSTITASTNNSNGYNIAMSTATSNNSLVHSNPAYSIPSLGSTFTPTATTNLSGSASNWGFRANNLGNFGSTTTQETDEPTSGYSWAAVPSSANPLTLRSSNSPTDDGVTDTPFNMDVWFGVSATQTQAAGQYSVHVVYTIVAGV